MRFWKGLAKREERYLEKQLEEKKMPPSLNQTLFRASVLATLVGGALIGGTSSKVGCPPYFRTCCVPIISPRILSHDSAQYLSRTNEGKP